MAELFDSSKPIFMQVRAIIEDQIVNNQLREGEQAPSTNQLVQFYKINHLTVAKGINQLVDEGILYKQRGIGMFVAEGSREKLMEQRRAAFIDDYVVSLVREAEKLHITEEEIMDLIKQVKEGDRG